MSTEAGLSDPVMVPAPDWEPVQPFPNGPPTHSFVSGTAAMNRTRITYFRRSSSDHLHACVWFGPGSEGPPASVHGGAIAAVLDEAMGAVCWMNGHPVVGARITINYVQMTPVGFAGRVESWIDRIEGRKCFIRSRLTDTGGGTYAEGDALFVKLTPEQMQRAAATRAERDAGRQGGREAGGAGGASGAGGAGRAGA